MAKKRIVINNYEELSGHMRSNWKSYYFKFDADMINGNGIYELTPDAKILYYFLILTAIKHRSSEISVNLETISTQLNILRGIKGVLTELKANNLIDFALRLDHLEVSKKVSKKVSKQVFDFEVVYKSYPRKKGKKKGLDKLETLIKSQDDFDALVIGVNNFAKETKVNKTEETYIPYFSTFVNGESWKENLSAVETDSEAVKRLFKEKKNV